MSNFEKAAAAIKQSGEDGAKMTNEELIIIYGLFKQANMGDNNTEKPGMLDFKGKAKWEAWNANKGMSKADAEAKYCDEAKGLLTKYGKQTLISW